MVDTLTWHSNPKWEHIYSNVVFGTHFRIEELGDSGKYYAYKYPDIQKPIGGFNSLEDAKVKCQKIVDAKATQNSVVKLATDKSKSSPLFILAYPTNDWDDASSYDKNEIIQMALESLEEGHSFVAVQYNSEDDVEGITQEIINDCAASFLDGFEGEPLDAPNWSHETDAWSDYRDQWDSDEIYGTEQGQVSKLYRSAV